jgi:hypothetical protein
VGRGSCGQEFVSVQYVVLTVNCKDMYTHVRRRRVASWFLVLVHSLGPNISKFQNFKILHRQHDDLYRS